MGRRKQGWRSLAARICPDCGRELKQMETCECTSKLPRDGCRAKCPQFKARASYHGRHYISCGPRNYKFVSKDTRDAHYMVFCCGSCTSCTAYNTEGGKNHG